jgi:hypothetical protein
MSVFFILAILMSIPLFFLICIPHETNNVACLSPHVLICQVYIPSLVNGLFKYFAHLKLNVRPGMVVNACGLSYKEAKVGGLLEPLSSKPS